MDVFDGVVKVRYCLIRCGRRGNRDNSTCFKEAFWSGACVCGGRNCEEYILVGLFI